jgi:hypothetical protein
MPNPPNSTKRSRLHAAGWVHVEGWVPDFAAETTRARIEAFEPEAERIANTPQERGRPRKEPKDGS